MLFETGFDDLLFDPFDTNRGTDLIVGEISDVGYVPFDSKIVEDLTDSISTEVHVPETLPQIELHSRKSIANFACSPSFVQRLLSKHGPIEKLGLIEVTDPKETIFLVTFKDFYSCSKAITDSHILKYYTVNTSTTFRFDDSVNITIQPSKKKIVIPKKPTEKEDKKVEKMEKELKILKEEVRSLKQGQGRKGPTSSPKRKKEMKESVRPKKRRKTEQKSDKPCWVDPGTQMEKVKEELPEVQITQKALEDMPILDVLSKVINPNSDHILKRKTNSTKKQEQKPSKRTSSGCSFVQTPYGHGILTLRREDGFCNVSFPYGEGYVSKLNISPIHGKVMTPYGAGKLLYVRKDGFLNVKFPWGLGCIRHECVKPFAEKNSSKLAPTTPPRKRKRASSAPKTKSHKKRKTTKNKGKEKQVDKIKEKKKKKKETKSQDRENERTLAKVKSFVADQAHEYLRPYFKKKRLGRELYKIVCKNVVTSIIGEHSPWKAKHLKKLQSDHGKKKIREKTKRLMKVAVRAKKKGTF